MHRLQDVLTPSDLAHLRTILGEREDPTHSGTKRRFRVNQITTDDTFIALQARDPFQALSPDERERLLSDIVWQLTCYVEGSITQSRGTKGIPLEHGFKLVRLEQEGKLTFCVVKHD
ncbi:MAG: hypothetical protein JO332_03635 [Planctomycetaceae bacterium]|nr:hypothetical protein [Planctomycetaceae bacterium]